MKNIINVSVANKVSSENNNLVIKNEEEVINIIPIDEIETLILDNYRCSLTLPVINLCSQNNVEIHICNEKHIPISCITSNNIYYHQTLRINEQIKWSQIRKNKLGHMIIAQKIKHQLDLLNYFKLNSGEMKLELRRIDKNNYLEKESLFARLYFRELFGSSFIRHQDDEVNSALNYGYGLLRNIIRQEIVAKGLHPSLGIFHKSRTNNFNLADDLIEVYRPLVDYVVYLKLLHDDNFTKDERIIIQEVMIQKVIVNGKEYEFRASVRMFIQQIIKYMNKEINQISLPSLEIRRYLYGI